MQSVTALQGNAGLSRSIALTVKHTEDLMQVLEAMIPRRSTAEKGDSVHAMMSELLFGFR
ncbi:hypothetical protein F444_02016 [Phytophthora nicotianae P1976]|uniref:Uncharacterized protein n=1 Tax=Phytophthora nicotianae P1976 TaxID=1317066 RepID=A0A081AYT4_PHYNI|nr:hypothetical protein F444_02016 [Phytophthora nicotianae P1976]